MAHNIGFISTRFAGTDGVSLESSKWAEVLWEDGHISYWYSGFSDRPKDVSFIVPEAFFGHPDNLWINERVWGAQTRDREVTKRIQKLVGYLKNTLYDFVEHYEIQLLVLQNALSIPMHVPLGIALTEFLAETGIPAIAHHHDFFWERSRFLLSAVQDYIDMGFPPNLPNLRHVVINKAAQGQLGFRKGISSHTIPNVFNFEIAPPSIDDYSKDLRETIGLSPEDKIILQPTRVIPRKGIEHAIKLVSLIEDPRYKLVISHASGDEGPEYKEMVEEYAKERNVDLRFISPYIGDKRHKTADNKKIYTLWDLYPHADFVTYPSTYEGFGNAFLEAIYFRKPLLVNRYSIFIQDIEPKGFDLVVMDGIVSKNLAEKVRRIIENEQLTSKIVDHNYEIAKKYFGYNVLRRSLRTLMTSLTAWSPS